MENPPQKKQTALQPDDPRLEKFRLFTDLGREELIALLQLSDTLAFPHGSLIVQEGDEGHCLYVLLEGGARVTAGSGGKEVELAQIGPGDFFGEISLVDDGPRSANVTTLGNCTLLRITRTTIGVLAGLHPSAAIQILGAIGRSLVRRLRAGNQKYLDILLRAGLSE